MIDINNDFLFIEKISLECCDYIWPNLGEMYEHKYKYLNKGLGNNNYLDVKPYSIIMVDLLWIYGMNQLNQIKVPFYIISSGYDYSIPFFSHHCNFSLIPLLENKNLKKWFSVNINFYHPKLVNIPIGLIKNIPIVDNKFMGWYKFTDFNRVNEHLKKINCNYFENFKRSDKKLLYCKMSVINTGKDIVLHQYVNIREKAIIYLQNKGFDIKTELIEWDSYMNELKEHKFCLSLPGRGIECFRTWESLSFGVIPIILNTGQMSMYDDLPVVIINNIEEITNEFLEYNYNTIINKLDKYNFHKLTSNYWINLIKNEILLEKQKNLI
jgi:hypothetical protein